MPNTQITNLTEVIDEVSSRLGGSTVEVELEPDDYQKALNQAIRLYNRNKPMRSFAALSNVVSATKKYGPINSGKPGFQGVVNVVFIRERAQFGDPFDTPFHYAYYHGGLTLLADTFGEIDQRIQYVEMSERVVSSEPEYHGQWEGDDYYLYIDIPSEPMMVGIEFTWHLTPDDDADTGLSRLPDSDVDWVLDFTLAVCKETLARIRGKHSGIQGPDGTTQDVDWRELLQEGRDDQEKLREAIHARRRPLPPVIG